MRSASLFLVVGVGVVGLGLASCEGPKPEGQKSIAPHATAPMKKADAPGPAAAAAPAAAPVKDHPAAKAPGMGFMPDYNGGGEGMRIADVRPDGAAAKAGIQTGDIITKFANIPIGDVNDYMAALETVKVGDVVDIVIKRGSETKTLKGTVGVSNR